MYTAKRIAPFTSDAMASEQIDYAGTYYIQQQAVNVSLGEKAGDYTPMYSYARSSRI